MREKKKHTGISQYHGSIADAVVNRKNQIRSKGAREKACPGSGCPANDFLKERFVDIPLEFDLDVDIDRRIDKEKSIDNVFSSIRRYLSLLGVDMKTKPTGRFTYDINLALIELDENITERGVYSNLELNGDILSVHIVRSYKVFDLSFVFLPISSVKRMPSPLADVFVDFVGFYARTQGICLPIEHNYFYFHICEENEGFFDDYEYTKYSDSAKEARKSYRDGEYSQWFSRIASSMKSDKEILELLRALKSSCSRKDLELISCMEDGVSILSSGCITSFNYNPDMNDCDVLNGCYDYEPFDISQNYAICWDFNDPVTQIIEEYINCLIREVCCYGVTESVILSPETSSVFVKNPFPEMFEKWFMKFLNLLEEYGTDK
ncbi:hypothetical protein [Bacteroides pyogenes]|uniref:Uncharacterized protein n=1 Tax=Bacteroides pyogenes TaxID=310300 RepID=A0A5D3EI19_9BACE|nr:hypothetical protein [Bacteroides pyogenes]TYK35619.1 hypothetical protein FNJ60_00460 [Bacteroides pyogenes]